MRCHLGRLILGASRLDRCSGERRCSTTVRVTADPNSKTNVEPEPQVVAKRTQHTAATSSTARVRNDPAVTVDDGGVHARRKATVGLVETKPTETSAIDRAVGINLRRTLGDQTLADAAANAKHLQKMEQSASVV